MLEIIRNRRSVRSYLPQDVSDELVMKLLDAAHLAPSGHNVQPWTFIVIRDESIKGQIAEVDHQQQWMLEAPVFIAVVADPRARGATDPGICNEYSDLPELKPVIRDTAIAIDHMILMAEELGLSTCWTGWYKQDDMKRVLGVPEDRYVVGVVTVGYGAEHPDARPRKDLAELIMYEKWQQR